MKVLRSKVSQYEKLEKDKQKQIEHEYLQEPTVKNINTNSMNVNTHYSNSNLNIGTFIGCDSSTPTNLIINKSLIESQINTTNQNIHSVNKEDNSEFNNERNRSRLIKSK